MKSSGVERGEPSGYLPPTAFVSFVQNHDQIGNRALGERITAIAKPEAVQAIGAIYLLLPQIPMLFMGEEWGGSQPFPYFCDFDGELGDKIRKGRREEFAGFPEFKDPEQRNRIPDPLARETFLSAKLDWAESKKDIHAERIDWYRRLLTVRNERIVPILGQLGPFAGSYHMLATGAVLVCWTIEDGKTLLLAANLSDNSVDGFETLDGDILWHEGPEPAGAIMRPWSVRWLIATGERHERPEALSRSYGIQDYAPKLRGREISRLKAQRSPCSQLCGSLYQTRGRRSRLGLGSKASRWSSCHV